MSGGFQPDLAVIEDAFSEEVVAMGGTVGDRFAGDTRLFLRSVTDRGLDIRLGDRLQWGVALFCVAQEIRVHPYHYRLVCRNGAVRAHATQTRRVIRADDDATAFDAAQVEQHVREAVRLCASHEAVEQAERELHGAAERDADWLLTMLPLLARRHSLAARHVTAIIGGFRAARDRTVFGLMNAITSLARDTDDPEERRRLEELGGSIPATMPTAPKPVPERARAGAATTRSKRRAATHHV